LTLNDRIAPTIQQTNQPTTEQSTDLLGTTTNTSEQVSVTEFKDAIAPETSVAAVAALHESSDDLSSLKRFLMKPRIVATRTMSSASGTLGAGSIDFSTFFSFFDIVAKMYTYFGCRFTMCAKLTVNVTPFDSGQIALVYMPPLYTTRAATTVALRAYRHLPHAELDIAESTSVELRIPYYSPKRYLKTTEVVTPNLLGTFQVTSPLTNIFAGNSSEYKLYYWIEDVELLYPTNLTRLITGFKERMWEAQGPEKQNVSGGTVVLSQSNYDANYGITAQAVPMAMNVVNKEYTDNRTDNFYELFSVPCPISFGTISTGVTGNAFQTQRVGPSTTGVGTFSKLMLSTLFFKFWSGTLNYRMKLFATKFHSGRIQIAFIPGPGITITNVPSNLDDYWNIIWDIRESSEISFSVPYIDDKFATLGTEHTGSLVFKVLNPIQAPDNVTQFVSYYLEAWAGDDYTVLAPFSSLNLKSTAFPPGFREAEDEGYESDHEYQEEEEWESQGPPSISDKNIQTPTNYVNEGDCSISDLVAKPGPPCVAAPSTTVNGIYFPPSVAQVKFDGLGTVRNVSNLVVLANMFQFYRGDLVGSNLSYTALDEYGSAFPVAPYVCNLRYNEVFPVRATSPLKIRRLHKGSFFYAWYPIAVVQA